MTKSKALTTVSPSTFLVDDEVDLTQFGEHFQISPTGMLILGRPKFELCEQMAKALRIHEKGLQFAIGDFLNWAEGIFGEEASQLIDNERGWTESTQKIYQWVAGKVPPQVRRAELSYTHHQIVARLNTPEEQKLWLDRAVEGTDGTAWTVSDLKRAISEAGRDIVFNPKEPKYLVIVECDGVQDVEACCRQLENIGRTKIKTKLPPAA